MNHTIHGILEKMVPDLQDMKMKGILADIEIKEIVKKRRKFEHKLRAIGTTVERYCEAIEYEKQLEKFRRKRKKNLGIEEHCKSDFSILSRIHHLFLRGLRKFTANLSLWWYYFDFAAAAKSGASLSRAFTRCLQLHPNAEEVWLRAANWEFFQNGNIIGARKLLQRGLELNTTSEVLWLGYFKLEIKYAQKLKARRRVLGLDKIRKLDQSEEEKKENEFIDKAIFCQEIFKKALNQIPNNPKFLKNFLSLLPPIEHFPQLHTCAFNYLQNMKDSSIISYVANWVYNFHLNDINNEVEAMTKCLEEMNEKIENFNDPEIINQLIIYFWSEIDKNRDATKLILTQLTTWIDSIQDENLTMEILKISVEIILILTNNLDAGIQKLEEYRHIFQRNEEWWLLLSNLISNQADNSKLEKTLWKALKACGKNPTLIKVLGDFAENMENKADTHKMFKKILLKDIKNSSLQNRYFKWCVENDKSILDSTITFMMRDLSLESKTFLYMSNLCNPKQSKRLLEENCSAHGRKDPECWLALLGYLQQTDPSKIPHTYQRACSSLENAANLFLKFAVTNETII